MFKRSMQGNLFIVLAKLLFKRKHCLALAYVTTLFNCYKKTNKMFVAWWVNPFNIDMGGGDLNPLIILFCFLNISFLCLESYYFFIYIICSFGVLF